MFNDLQCKQQTTRQSDMFVYARHIPRSSGSAPTINWINRVNPFRLFLKRSLSHHKSNQIFQQSKKLRKFIPNLLSKLLQMWIN